MFETIDLAGAFTKDPTREEVQTLFSARCIIEYDAFKYTYYVWPSALGLPELVLEVPRAGYYLDRHCELLTPLYWQHDPALIEQFRIEFNGFVDFIYGDLRKMKNGRKYFRILPPGEGKHLLLRAHWSKASQDYFSISTSKAKRLGARYFRSTKPNERGTGYDFWVLSLDYDTRYGIPRHIYESLLATSRNAHQASWVEHVSHEQRLLREYWQCEKYSMEHKDRLLPQFEELQKRIWVLRNTGYRWLTRLQYDDTKFRFQGKEWFYSKSTLRILETIVGAYERDEALRQQLWPQILALKTQLKMRERNLELDVVTEVPYNPNNSWSGMRPTLCMRFEGKNYPYSEESLELLRELVN